MLEYDNVMNTQREVIYAQRQKVLDGEDLRSSILNMLRTYIDSTVSDVLSYHGGTVEESTLALVLTHFDGFYFPKGSFIPPETLTQDTLCDAIYDQAVRFYQQKETAISQMTINGRSLDMREIERTIMLHVVDEYWMDNIDAMEDLKQGIGLRAYGQHDPVVAYKEEGYQMFQAMVTAIREETVRRLFRFMPVPRQEIKRVKVAKEVSTSGTSDGTVKKQPIRNKDKKVGPNDPCPCGSGKKYKKCCMQKEKQQGME